MPDTLTPVAALARKLRTHAITGVPLPITPKDAAELAKLCDLVENIAAVKNQRDVARDAAQTVKAATSGCPPRGLGSPARPRRTCRSGGAGARPGAHCAGRAGAGGASARHPSRGRRRQDRSSRPRLPRFSDRLQRLSHHMAQGVRKRPVAQIDVKARIKGVVVLYEVSLSGACLRGAGGVAANVAGAQRIPPAGQGGGEFGDGGGQVSGPILGGLYT